MKMTITVIMIKRIAIMTILIVVAIFMIYLAMTII